MSDLDADTQRVCRVIPLHQAHPEPSAALGVAVLAERMACLLACTDRPERYAQSEMIRAIAAGDRERTVAALEMWT